MSGDDAWTIVKTKKKLNSNSNSNSSNNNNNNSNNKSKKNKKKSNQRDNNNTGYDDDDVNSYDDVIKVINATIIELKQSSYYIKLIEGINSSLASKNSNSNDNSNSNEYKLTEIVSLGIGSFSRSPSALLQLVMTLCLAQEFLHDNNDNNHNNHNNHNDDNDNNHNNHNNDSKNQTIKYNCMVFDPIFNDVEVLVCTSLGLNVSKENKYGKHTAIIDNADDTNKITLYFMPHCPYRLYCNLLWKNWSHLGNIMIYGNSFSSYGLRRMNNSSTKKKDLTDCIVCMESFIVEKTLSLDISRKNVPKELLHFENAFNDLRY